MNLHDENDPGMSDADRAVIRSVQTGEGAVVVGPDMLPILLAQAGKTMRTFEQRMATMTRAQAEFARKLRVDEGYSLRATAHACYVEWGGDWTPPSNQIMGMAICERAATFFDEDGRAEPWA